MEKKNTILLTVIAIATLLVAVVGATFAYFIATGGGSSEKQVIVKTESVDSSAIAIAGDISITADMTNFGQTGGKDVAGNTTGQVTFHPGSGVTEGTGARNYCYKVQLDLTGNPFDYSAANNSHENQPELIFTAEKQGAGATSHTKIIDAKDITTDQSIIQIPTEADGSIYIHKITGTANQAYVEGWKFNVTFKYYNFPQNDNANKNFTAKLKMFNVDCTTGEEITNQPAA